MLNMQDLRLAHNVAGILQDIKNPILLLAAAPVSEILAALVSQHIICIVDLTWGEIYRAPFCSAQGWYSGVVISWGGLAAGEGIEAALCLEGVDGVGATECPTVCLTYPTL